MLCVVKEQCVWNRIRERETEREQRERRGDKNKEIVESTPRLSKVNIRILAFPLSELTSHCKVLIEKWGFPGGAVVENLPANAGDTGSSPGLGRFHMPRNNWAREPHY